MSATERDDGPVGEVPPDYAAMAAERDEEDLAFARAMRGRTVEVDLLDSITDTTDLRARVRAVMRALRVQLTRADAAEAQLRAVQAQIEEAFRDFQGTASRRKARGEDWEDVQDAADVLTALAALSSDAAPQAAGVTRGVDLIAAERQRQIDVEGYTAEHDAGHVLDLVRAAICYATLPGRRMEHTGLPPYRIGWPWEASAWKPTPDDRTRELVKAGALMAAAIDALLPVAAAPAAPEGER